MQKIVINVQYGGFGLSPLALKRLAELQGRECYFFKKENLLKGPYIPITIEEATAELMFDAFDIPNPNDVLPKQDNWWELSDEERRISNQKYKEHEINDRNLNRTDKHLVQVVKELKEKANGQCATLKIVDVPDNVEWEIEEYDGNEWVAEKHRRWD